MVISVLTECDVFREDRDRVQREKTDDRRLDERGRASKLRPLEIILRVLSELEKSLLTAKLCPSLHFPSFPPSLCLPPILSSPQPHVSVWRNLLSSPILSYSKYTFLDFSHTLSLSWTQN